ncbi:glutathione transferase [Histoplasma capsulatum var. duboisii H88]|uniref:Glutathione transferase n=2 Tax=Ajellomyces capsulatus TaxID=5037 RepID=F0UNC0_AJEC8|nr:glutathione transferase [Histoplasma capsulatum H143]EGC47578.1 glutathione transferase [Histoplasma capsulatum var. duboisii H88]
MAPLPKPLVLHGKLIGPNPFKVALILGELNLPYTIDPIELADVKTPAVISLNPNGRLPALTDPNTGLTIWESGAIIEYLVATYDNGPKRKLSFEPGSVDYWHAIQWLHFQMSGQGPYFGQSFWFQNHHPEILPSAITRYENEARRVCSVLDGWLGGRLGVSGGGIGKERKYLVAEKCSFADLAFIPWQENVQKCIRYGADGGAFDQEKEFPHMHAWLERIKGREAVKKAFVARAEAKKGQTEREVKK